MFFSSFFPIVTSLFCEKCHKLPDLDILPSLGRKQTQALLPNILCHIPNENTSIIYPLDPCARLHPFVTSGCSDFQDPIALAGSRDLPFPGLPFYFCIAFVVLAQHVNIAPCDERIPSFPSAPS